MTKATINLYLLILMQYTKARIMQSMVISIAIASLWSCQRQQQNVNIQRLDDILPQDVPFIQEPEQQLALPYYVERDKSIVDEVNIEYELAKKLGSVVDLMTKPEKRSPCENKLRTVAVVTTGLAIGTAVAIAYYSYPWYTQELPSNNLKMCFERLHNATNAHKHTYEDYVTRQRTLLDHQPANADTQDSIVVILNNCWRSCGEQGNKLLACYHSMHHTNHMNDTHYANLMPWLYRSVAAFAGTALGSFVGKECFGKSGIENQQNSELFALKEKTLQSYRSALHNKRDRDALKMLDIARKKLKKFFCKASRNHLGKYKEGILSSVGLIDKIQDLKRSVQDVQNKKSTITKTDKHQKILRAYGLYVASIDRMGPCTSVSLSNRAEV